MEKDIKCPHCDSKDFTVFEEQFWKASSEGNTLNCWHKGVVVTIKCDACKEDLTEEFKDCLFNFQ